MTGAVQGGFRTVNGEWLGIVHFEVPYADGRRAAALRDQLVPAYALRRRNPYKRSGTNLAREGYRDP